MFDIQIHTLCLVILVCMYMYNINVSFLEVFPCALVCLMKPLDLLCGSCLFSLQLSIHSPSLSSDQSASFHFFHFHNVKFRSSISEEVLCLVYRCCHVQVDNLKLHHAGLK